ncbi:cytochrome P450 [Actinoplanes utahensis]|uniref:Cytochrome P450 n=1 Tax=Actinoplanes utahensis TaxID=1869 RepID=A0A0A6UDS2_ACTUT|nr:cytochrome P450 [Actinoplanes utahensis]KHD74185.1 cytochrome P450 [Actinoplanes utahensis]GIF33671.1 cytochrome P450 [Actinoplanes utahensis]
MLDVARRHEFRVLAAAKPTLPVLLTAGRLAGKLRRVPRIGWVSADPVVARRILNDPAHFTLLGEGGVGHLWAQVLGDWVNEIFDGPGHHLLRARTRDLFTDDSARRLTARVIGSRLARAGAELDDGRAVDVADLGRVLVGRIVADLLQLDVPDHDEAYREIFATGEELAALALGTTTSTHLAPETIARARTIVAKLTVNVDRAWRTASPETVLGRCRDLGLERRQAEGLATLLMVAGTETAASAMARTVAILHDTGAQHRLRADRDLLPDAVREGLRVTSPAPVIGRAVSADVTVEGRRLRAGERVLMLTWTANNAAGAFDLDRGYLPDQRQLWFGAGRHLCLGAPVARAEITGLLEMLLRSGRPWRIRDRTYRRNVLIPSYACLPVRLARH